MVGKITLGAIDAGSNALRVVVAELGPTELIRIEAERVPIRLGHGAFTRAELDAKTVDQAVAAFVHFRERFDHHAVAMYRAVATSAVRNASNRDVLLHRLYHEAGIELEVIEGEEEARLVRKAVVHAIGPTATPPRAILDLGGGSLEVNLRHGASWRAHSLPIGTVRLLETFGLDGAIGDAESAMVRRYAATLMHTIGRSPSARRPGRRRGGDRRQRRGAREDRRRRPPAAMPSFELAALEKALPELVGATVEERMALFGVKRDRAEVLGIAALVFATVARQLGIARLVAPGVGVREGVLIELAETAREEQARAEGAHDKALLTAARGFANRVDHDTTHGEHVRHLSRALFHQLRDVHGVPDDLGVLLEVAALLHDVGEVVNQRGHHKHSEYMIRWARIPGMDDPTREMVALMVRVPPQGCGARPPDHQRCAAVQGPAHPGPPHGGAAAHRRRPRHRPPLARRAGRVHADGRRDRARPGRSRRAVARRRPAAAQGGPVPRRARPRRPRHGRAVDRATGRSQRPAR